MADQNELLLGLVDGLASLVMVLEPGDLMAYGDVLTQFEQLSVVAEGGDDPGLAHLTASLQSYMEGMILGQVEDQETGVQVLTNGVQLAQEMLRGDSGHDNLGKFLAESGMEPFAGQAADQPDEEPVEELDVIPESKPDAVVEQDQAEEPAVEAAEEEAAEEAPIQQAPAEPAPEPAPAEDMGVVEVTNEEDKELMSSFVAEALEHLESIEINTLLLEDDPENQDTLNAVFRPFHTIKGVSGFLDLRDINRLSHSLENLLDKARAGEITIGGQATDVILAGVDTLRQMITEAQTSMDEGRARQPFATAGLVQRIDQVLDDTEGAEDQADDEQAVEETRVPPLGEVLVEDGVVEPEEVEAALKKQQMRPEKPIGEILVSAGAAAPGEVADGLKKQRMAAGPKKSIAAQEVKIDTIKLDNLLDMVGELVIAQSMVQANPKVQAINDRKLASDIGQLARITSELQKTTMSMRMVPIKQTFQRMVRVVRDTAKKQGKKIRLELEGEGTEIDRNMVEKFYDPLVHMVRNSVDHGIESPEDRTGAGKPEEGLVVLAAYHQGGAVCIEIRDDGKGLDREVILNKAIEKGLVEDGEGLSDEEVFGFIFQAGFSTAEQVTDISGRGVGMDVVQKTIDSLRGKVSVKSKKGQGTTLTIALPLTLAIIDGMVVEVGGERFILPTVSVLESLRPTKDDYNTVKGRGEMIMIRGNLLPLIRLDQVVNVQAEHQQPWEGLVVVVEHHGQRRCLMVDRLIGRQEVVIKALGEHLKMVRVVAGGAIMGDGRVGLILDIDGIFKSLEGH